MNNHFSSQASSDTRTSGSSEYLATTSRLPSEERLPSSRTESAENLEQPPHETNSLPPSWRTQQSSSFLDVASQHADAHGHGARHARDANINNREFVMANLQEAIAIVDNFKLQKAIKHDRATKKEPNKKRNPSES